MPQLPLINPNCLQLMIDISKFDAKCSAAAEWEYLLGSAA